MGIGAILYYLLTFAEAALGAVGIRGVYEQPRYTVVQRLPGGVELRDYPARLAAETDDAGDGDAAFGRLFRYIAGENAGRNRIAMTAPVSQERSRIAMTAPVQSGDGAMRFFLPRGVAGKGAPAPLDPAVRIVTVPPERLAVRRFSGVPDRGRTERENEALLTALADARLHATGKPILLAYDAPFTIPFLRRNEAAVRLAGP